MRCLLAPLALLCISDAPLAHVPTECVTHWKAANEILARVDDELRRTGDFENVFWLFVEREDALGTFHDCIADRSEE